MIWALTALLTVLCAMYLVGVAVARYMSRGKLTWGGLFIACVCSLTFIAALTGAVFCSGRTLLLPILVLAPALLLRSRNRLDSTQDYTFGRSWLIIRLGLALGIVSFACWLVVFIPPDGSMYNFLGDDHIYYSNLANYIADTGLENNYLDLFNVAHHTVSPYHYGDIYLIGFISRFFGLNATVALVLVVYPLLTTIAAIGCIALMQNLFPRLKLRLWLILLLPVLVLVSSGFSSLYPVSVLHIDNADVSMFRYSKLLFAFVALITLLICFVREWWPEVFLTTAIFILFYLPFAGAGAGGLGLLLLHAVIRRQIGPKKFMILSAGVLLLILFIAAFYSLLSSKSEKYYPVPDAVFSIKDVIRISVIYLAAALLQLSSYSLHIILGLCCYLQARRQKTDVGANQVLLRALRLVGAFFIGAFAARIAAYNAIPDSSQLLLMVSATASNIAILLLYCVVFLREKTHVSIKVAGVILCMANVTIAYTNHNHQYTILKSEYQSLKSFIGSDKPRFAQLASVVNPSPVFGVSYEVWKPTYALAYEYSPYTVECINTTEIRVNTAGVNFLRFEHAILNELPFTLFYLRHEKHLKTLEEIQLAFLRNGGFEYLFTKAEQPISPALLTRIDRSIFLPGIGYNLHHLRL